jgi:hypothetical protein
MVSGDTLAIDGLRYLFYPERYPHAPGYPRLDILLPEGSEEMQGRAPCLIFDAIDGNRSIERVCIQHTAVIGEESYRMCAGRLILSGVQDEPVQIFTFGSTMNLGHRARATLCQITSPAPLIPLQLAYRHSTAMRLAEEIEVLFAQRRAAWGYDPGAYEQQLALADPHTLYLACLEALSIEFQDFCLEAEHDFILEFISFLQTEIQTIQKLGEWPSHLCSLKDLI